MGEPGLELSPSSFLGVPGRGVESALARSAFALAMFAIQLGCAFFAALGLGDSGRVSALSIQLDFVGLKRFEGLPGGEVAPSSPAALCEEKTDLLRPCRDIVGLVKVSYFSPPCVMVRFVRLLLLEVGREDGSWLDSPLPGVGSSFGMLYDP